MISKAQLQRKILRLERQVKKLSLEKCELENELKLTRRHERNSTGSRGERYIQSLIGGKVTSNGAGHDLEIRGKRLEIKTSQCRRVDQNRDQEAVTKRWTWHRPFGENGTNKYHFLVLIGDMDSRFRKLYRDQEKPASRYVIFLIPKRRVQQFVTETEGGAMIQITTNPKRQRTSKGRKIWNEDFQKTRHELKKLLLSKRG